MPRLNLFPKRQQDAGGTLAIHPGSGSEKKNWPEERWHELLKLIAKGTSWRVVLIGGEAEGERLQRLATLLPIERLAVALNKPLPELAQTLMRCAAFLGHDSGITHLAAAVEVPGVAIWGGTNERIWRPLGPAFTLLRDERGLAYIEPHRVLEAVTDIMK